MANERVYWSGKVTWNYLDKMDNFGRYSICFYPDTKAYNEIMKLKQEGLQNTIKKDDEGYYINISRPTQLMGRGKVIELTKPELLDSDGKTPFKGSVGHGSDVTIKVEVRRYQVPGAKGQGLAIRLESMRVDNLVPFDPQRDFPPAQAKMVAGLDKAPKSENPF